MRHAEVLRRNIDAGNEAINDLLRATKNTNELIIDLIEHIKGWASDEVDNG
jgi:hypothetical protein